MNSTISLLIEVRKRLLHTLVVFLGLCGLFFVFSAKIFHLYMLPLQHLLTAPQRLIATQITAPLITPLAMAINLAVLTTIPYGLWQFWRFAAPALYRSERHTLGFVFCGSIGLFCLGVLFGYFFILPFMFQCMIQAVPRDVLLLPDISSVTHFITGMLVVFGLSFQIPLICILLVRLNWLRVEQYRALRPYIIVAAFTLGMLLTPPDLLSQILLAMPLWGLYESGVYLARIFAKSNS